MRNVFDQYDQPENRLTHALACALSEDPALLRRFLRWAAPVQPPARARLEVLEQRIPGEAVVDLDDDVRRGLPDMWIHDGDGWALLVESKVKSPIKTGQLRRHLATAKRHDFDRVGLLVLAANYGRHKPLEGVEYRLWEDVYAWLLKHRRRSPWAARVIDYMEIAESQMVAKEYLKVGNLTTFNGVHFDADNPYNYREAKRVLKLMMDALQARKDLEKGIETDPEGERRPAIKGRDMRSVWDFIPLVGADPDRFTAYPHVDVSLNQDGIEAAVILPSGAQRTCWKNLADLEEDAFKDLVQTVTRQIERAVRRVPGAKPYFIVLQRHYPSQSSPPVIDGTMKFDLRTALSEKQQGVKPQAAWIESVHGILKNRRGTNLQIGIGAMLPYGSKVVASKAILNVVAQVWLACGDWLNVMLDGAD